MEGRGGYYDSSGALRDMVQNHMMQLLSLVAMEPPTTLDGAAIHDEKVKVLRAIRPMTPEQVQQLHVARPVRARLNGRANPFPAIARKRTSPPTRAPKLLSP